MPRVLPLRIQWIRDPAEVLVGDVGVDLRRLGTTVAEEFLNMPHADASFKQMYGKAVTEGVDCGVLGAAGSLHGPLRA